MGDGSSFHTASTHELQLHGRLNAELSHCNYTWLAATSRPDKAVVPRIAAQHLWQ